MSTERDLAIAELRRMAGIFENLTKVILMHPESEQAWKSCAEKLRHRADRLETGDL